MRDHEKCTSDTSPFRVVLKVRDLNVAEKTAGGSWY